ncbi:MAG: prepilin-type N-terminal cleavage/methylation domain-containing protein [Verrucomicrobia bacterium]|nr:prepilin-type N-terminal cleavage/methylation domain-containing protein [Verrucomicrobiota bacterium]
MSTNLRLSRGFTLVEIMIVVAIIALLAALAIPGFVRARKRSQAVMIKNELKLIDAAVDQYALEYNRSGGILTFATLTPYFKQGRLVDSGGRDVFGNSYERFEIGTVPKLNDATYSNLSDVVGPEFWAPFYP